MRRMLSAHTVHHKLGIFVHIPKTGGLTLYWIMNRQYTPEAIFTLDWTKHFDGSVKDFVALPDAQKQPVKIVRGHMRFALRTVLPENAHYFTIFREPVERIISYYHYVRRSEHHPWYQELHAHNMTLQDFVTQVPDWNIDNCQTRFLADGYSWVEFDKCTADMVASAKQNMEKFAVIGLTERFDETLILLKRIFGWNEPVYFTQNVSPQKEMPMDGTIEAIQQRNHLDIELYQYAKTLVARQFLQQPLSFKCDLLRFKLLNKGFQKLHPYYYALKRQLKEA